jgi:hypothetical protein
MHAPIRLSLAASLSIAGTGVAFADSDPNLWRWYVTTALSGQQNGRGYPMILREGRASAVDPGGRFIQRHERFFVDGSLAPAGDTAQR